MLVSFVIPCYKSEKTINNVVEEIVETMDKLEGYEIEIILVNDSSPDNLIYVLKEMAADNYNVKVLDLANNFGQHGALMTGYSYAKGDIIVSLDDDGQSPVSDVMKMINKLEEGYDVVIAKYKEKKQSLFKNFGSFLNDRMASILINKPKELALSSFFVMKSFISKEIIKYNNPYPYIEGLLLRTTNKIINVDLENRERIEGESTYTLKKLIGLWLNGFTAFSIKPLRISIIIGGLFSIFGFIYGIYVIINKFINPNITVGWSSTMAFLSLVAGVILVMLGMIGEYIGRIYISINNSPQYVIREKINIEEDEYEYSYK